jgi:hypothetical protein
VLVASASARSPSGAKGRKDRPGLDAMLKAVARREFDLVMAWSVDQLGRSLRGCVVGCRSINRGAAQFALAIDCSASCELLASVKRVGRKAATPMLARKALQLMVGNRDRQFNYLKPGMALVAR